MDDLALDDLAFVRLAEIDENQILDLMNNAAVAPHMPLLEGGFTPEACRAFLAAKQRLWDAHGYGPWAFVIGGEFAGWGGLQPEQGDADFALVLHPRFWGWGRKIFTRIRDQAFGEMALGSITALLPPDRPNAKALTRLGFVEDGERTLDGARFLRFRLSKPGSGATDP